MIVGLGCLAHDHVLFTDTAWDSGKGRIVRTETRIGGNARNALATIAALDHPAAYLATVGTSPVSDLAMADLIAHNIDTRFIERVAGADPVTATVTVTAGGERYIAFDDSTLTTTPLPDEDLVTGALEVADAFLVDATNAPRGTRNLIDRARRAGIPVILDAERDPTPSMKELMEVADHLVIPRSLGANMTGMTDPSEIAARLWNDARSIIVLTDGAAGAFLTSRPGELVHVPAFPVDAIDTTGCGDAFHGAYAWGVVTGLDPVRSVTIASAAAAVIAGLPVGVPRVASREAIVRRAPGEMHDGLA